MFMPDDLKVRPVAPGDQKEALYIISGIQGSEQQMELQRQIKQMFLHPAIWVASGVIICVVGIHMDWPPVPTSIVVLVSMMALSKQRFTQYWNRIKPIYNSKSPDLLDLYGFYGERERRLFVIAEHRGRIVGTAAVRELPDENVSQINPATSDPETCCKLWRIFVHPAYRRMGIASRLIRDCLKGASRIGYNHVMVKTQKSNKAGIACYEKLNFKQIDEMVLSESYPLEFRTVVLSKDL